VSRCQFLSAQGGDACVAPAKLLWCRARRVLTLSIAAFPESLDFLIPPYHIRRGEACLAPLSRLDFSLASTSCLDANSLSAQGRRMRLPCEVVVVPRAACTNLIDRGVPESLDFLMPPYHVRRGEACLALSLASTSLSTRIPCRHWGEACLAPTDVHDLYLAAHRRHLDELPG
jgi:hypothetical protein